LDPRLFVNSLSSVSPSLERIWLARQECLLLPTRLAEDDVVDEVVAGLVGDDERDRSRGNLPIREGRSELSPIGVVVTEEVHMAVGIEGADRRRVIRRTTTPSNIEEGVAIHGAPPTDVDWDAEAGRSTGNASVRSESEHAGGETLAAVGLGVDVDPGVAGGQDREAGCIAADGTRGESAV